jgi:hypothetical protein
MTTKPCEQVINAYLNQIRTRDPEWRFVTPLDDRGNRSQHWSERVLGTLGQQSRVILWKNSHELAEIVTTGEQSS